MLVAAVADLLLIAMAAALSPFPLVAAIAAAGAANAGAGPAFAAGWVAALGALTAALVFFASEFDPTSLSPDAWIQILIGAGLLLAGFRKWRTRPRRNESPAPPGWMASFDGGAARAFGIGAALGANPKNIALATAGAAVLHYHGLIGRHAALAALAFVALASSTVIAIVLAGMFAGPRLGSALQALKRFMLRYNNLILTLLFAAVGGKILWNGLSALTIT